MHFIVRGVVYVDDKVTAQLTVNIVLVYKPLLSPGSWSLVLLYFEISIAASDWGLDPVWEPLGSQVLGSALGCILH